MTIEQIIFDIIKDNHRAWVRYWITQKDDLVNRAGEFIEIRSPYLTGRVLQTLFNIGFHIDTIRDQKINADAYCDVLLKRELNYKEQQQKNVRHILNKFTPLVYEFLQKPPFALEHAQHAIACEKFQEVRNEFIKTLATEL